MTESAVIYTRSSKDAHDVSPAAQRAELIAHAKKKGYRVVGDYSDSAISANANPPQLGALLRELDNAKRGFSVILAVDSSRLARDADLAGVIGYQVRAAGARIEFSKEPASGNAAFDVMMRSFMRGQAQYHSMVSKEKGIAGMKTNVANGHRAGGRAPLGYLLKHTATGAQRDGRDVTKSKLILNPELAPSLKVYLHARLRGLTRRAARAKAQLVDAAGKPHNPTTLIGIERNALTYAGHTVWNRLADPKMPLPTRDKFRPRAEWVIHKDTHPAMITETQAEALLQLAMPTEARKRRGPSGNFLLSGLLFTPEGAALVSSGDNYYRSGKGKRVPAAALESTVVRQLDEEMALDEYVDAFLAELQRASKGLATKREVLEKELKKAEKELASFMKIAAHAPDLRSVATKIRELEEIQTEVAARIARADEDAERARAIDAVGPKQARKWLDNARTGIASRPVDERAAVLASLIERIEFHPATGQGRIFYRLRQREPGQILLTRVKMASPRGFAAIPPFELPVAVPANRPYTKAA